MDGTQKKVRLVAALWLLHIVTAVALCFAPLFDILGFERAFVSGLLVAITSPILAVHRRRRRPKTPVVKLFKSSWLSSSMMLVPSLLVGLVVELIKTPCSPEEGAAFFLLLGVCNAAFGSAIGIAAASFKKNWMAGALVIAVDGLFLAATLARMYSDPQIFAFCLPFGYWPGSIYDEALSISPALWAFRAYSLALTFALVAAHAAMSRTTPKGGLRLALIAACAISVAWLTWSRAGKLGFDLDRDSIRQELSRHVQTEHFDIYVDPSVGTKHLEKVVLDHEFRWSQLQRFFGTAPEGRITSFVYRDVKQKQRLMGAGRTQIARPWAREIHIHGFNYPHGILKHELAHIFAGEFNSGPFGVPTRMGVVPRMGVVEGLAVAADWPTRELTVHGWTRAMRNLKLAPDIRSIISPSGFWGVSSSRAYTTAGSFFRFLIDKYGMDSFANLYDNATFETAYGRSLDDLASEWETFVDGLPLPEDELIVAQHRFSRPSVFQKVCAHRAATISEQGYRALNQGDLEAGEKAMQEILRFRQNDLGPLLALAKAYARADKLSQAQSYVDQALDRPRATKQEIGQAREMAGELAWRKGDIAAAQEAFTEVLGLNLSDGSRRAQAARLDAMTRSAPASKVLQDYLLGDINRTVAIVRLGNLLLDDPNDALLLYLYGRALENAGAWPEGADALAKADLPELPEALRTEAQLTYGRLLLGAGETQAAAELFAQTASTASTAVARQTAQDWQQRAQFLGLTRETE